MDGFYLLGLFILAVVFLVLGHVVRAKRWALIMPKLDMGDQSKLFFSLAAGYFVDFFVPVRLGEVVRVGIASLFLNGRMLPCITSVMLERITDVLALAVMFLVFQGDVLGIREGGTIGLVGIIFVCVVLLGFFVFLGKSKRLKKTVGVAAGLFNDNLRFGLLHMFWMFHEAAQTIVKQSRAYLGYSALMWSAYVASFFLISAVLDVSFFKIIKILLGEPLSPLVLRSSALLGWSGASIFCAFLIGPLAVYLIYRFAKKSSGLELEMFRRTLNGEWFEAEHGASRMHSFSTQEAYAGFLHRTFYGTPDLRVEFDSQAIDDVIVHRFFNGGSDALTALVQREGRLFVRKFAVNGGAEKLRNQYNWLETHAQDVPLVRIKSKADGRASFRYDMEFSASSMGLFEEIHTLDAAESWLIVRDVLEVVTDFHEKNSMSAVLSSELDSYVNSKVVANFESILDSMPALRERDNFCVNGKAIDLRRIRLFFNAESLTRRFRHGKQTAIHGDLTVENVLVDSSVPRGWFLIDPNVGNVFESPFIDYAKLMQSLHLGYEFLNARPICNIVDGGFLLSIQKSSQYAFLLELYKDWILSNLGSDALREIFLHEIVNYLRLTPYKFRHRKSAGLAFVAGGLVLVDEYIEAYGKD